MSFSGITPKFWHLNTTQRTKLIEKLILYVCTKFGQNWLRNGRQKPKMAATNLVFLTFQHQTAEISHASLRSPCFLFFLGKSKSFSPGLLNVAILLRENTVQILTDYITNFCFLFLTFWSKIIESKNNLNYFAFNLDYFWQTWINNSILIIFGRII